MLRIYLAEKQRAAERQSKHSDGAESGRHMKEYYCFSCMLMPEPEMRQSEQEEGGPQSRGEQV